MRCGDPLELCFVLQTFVIPFQGRLRLNDPAALAEGLLVGLGPLAISTALTECLVHCGLSLKILIPVFVGEYSMTVRTQADALR